MESLWIVKLSPAKQISALMDAENGFQGQHNLSLSCYPTSALSAKGEFSIPRWVRVWQSGKLLGWKGLDKSFPAPGVFQGWNCMEKSPLSEKTKDACGTFGSTSQLSLHLLSLLFLAAVLGESSWSVDFTAQPVGKFHQGGFLHAWCHGQGSASPKKRGKSEVWAPGMAFPARIMWNCEKETSGWILQCCLCFGISSLWILLNRQRMD